MPGGIERLHQAANDERPDSAGLAKANLRLGRMNVDVHEVRVERDEQREQRVAAARYEIAVGTFDRADQQLVADRPAVHEQELQARIGSVEGRQAREARDRYAITLSGDGERI